jgi:hypothetical protein
MKTNSLIIYLTVLIVVMVILVGCKAAPAPPAGFIQNHEIMVEDEKSPFHRAWYDRDADWDGYTQILVAPVNTDYLPKADWWEGVTLAVDRQKDSQQIANYMQTKVAEAFKSDPNGRFRLVDSTGPRTLVLEMALVQLVPTKVWLNAAGMIFAVTIDHGTVAMEARVRDGATGNVIATFADREHGKSSLVSVANLMWYSHAKHVIDDWAAQMVQVTKTGGTEHVEDSSVFTLQPW